MLCEDDRVEVRKSILREVIFWQARVTSQKIDIEGSYFLTGLCDLVYAIQFSGLNNMTSNQTRFDQFSTCDDPTRPGCLGRGGMRDTSTRNPTGCATTTIGNAYLGGS